MKTIGIIGGMSPESTVEYYRYIIHQYVKNYGDSSYPEIIIHSVSFQKYIKWMNTDNTEAIKEGLFQAAQSLTRAGADFLIIATNTMHLFADKIKKKCNLPLLEITEVVKEQIIEKQYKKVGVIGTKTCLNKGLYQNSLNASGIDVIIPSKSEITLINNIIFSELTFGKFLAESKSRFVEIIKSLEKKGARAIIMGCTEIPLLINESDVEIDLIDTTRIHALKTLEYALKEN